MTYMMRWMFVLLLGVMGMGLVSGAGAEPFSDADWRLLPSPYDPTAASITGTVHVVFTARNGDVYVGGSFTTAGGVAANNIARWDGSSWHAMGGGLSGPVHALTMYNGTLIAGGSFTQSVGVLAASAINIAQWDGAGWVSLGVGSKLPPTKGPGNRSGVDGAVRALVSSPVATNVFYAGGEFTSAGSTAVGYIAKWDGSTWSDMHGGVSNELRPAYVNGLAVQANQLYVAGDFSKVSGITRPAIARWNEATKAWSSMGSGLGWKSDFSAKSVAVIWGGTVFVGGDFGDPDEDGKNHNVLRWDGSAWHRMGDGLGTYDEVAALTALGKEVFAGMRGSSSGLPAGYVARWDGNAWVELGSGVDGDVLAMDATATELFVGGTFMNTTGRRSGSIARAQIWSAARLWMEPRAGVGGMYYWWHAAGMEKAVVAQRSKMDLGASSVIYIGPSFDGVNMSTYRTPGIMGVDAPGTHFFVLEVNPFVD